MKRLLITALFVTVLPAIVATGCGKREAKPVQPTEETWDEDEPPVPEEDEPPVPEDDAPPVRK